MKQALSRIPKTSVSKDIKRRRIAIIRSGWYDHLVKDLVASAKNTLLQSGVLAKHIDYFSAPGAFEIPLLAQELAIRHTNDVESMYEAVRHGHGRSVKNDDNIFADNDLGVVYQGIIVLGVVIRGETPHFDYVCSACAEGVMKVMLKTATPIGFGVLTVDNEKQAKKRLDKKGVEAAMAVLDMQETLLKLNVISPHIYNPS